MIILDFSSLVVIPLLIYIITKNITITIVFLCFCLRFLNSPDKKLVKQTVQPNMFYSPSSGYIREIINNDTDTTISLFLNVFDNHTQYIPITSNVISIEKFSGLFAPAFLEHSVNNTRVKTTLYNPKLNFTYTITQITGLLTRRIINFLQTQNQDTILTPGERLGFIVLGSRVDITILNKNIQQLVKTGDHVSSMERMILVK
jgi:phosphatidylserine decarboxylase